MKKEKRSDKRVGSILIVCLFNIIITLILSSYISASNLENRFTDKSHRESAIQEVYKQKEKYIPELLNIISKKGMNLRKVNKINKADAEKKSHARVTATMLLGKIKAVKAIEVLNNNLLSDEDEFVREASALAIMEMLTVNSVRSQVTSKRKNRLLTTDNGSQMNETIEALKKALDDESGNVRMRAILVLAKIKNSVSDSVSIDMEDLKKRALAGIKSKDTTESLLAVDAIESIGDKTLISILEKNLKSRNIWIKIHSMLAVKKLEIQSLNGEERLNYLKVALEDEQFEVSRWATIELMKIDSEETDKILNASAKEGNYAAGKVLKMKKMREEK